MVTEAANTKVDFTQAVKEKKASLNCRILKLPLHELERGKSAHLEKTPTGCAAAKNCVTLLRWQRRGDRFWSYDLGDDRSEFFVPPPQGCRIASAELRKRSGSALEIRPPL